MSKEHESKKEAKKKPGMTLKERRNAKREKQASKIGGLHGVKSG